jgi:hypothetical protein
MFLYGGAFIAIVLFLPKGLAGIYQDHIRKWFVKEKPNSPAVLETVEEIILEKEVTDAK